ncbi:hypothetical protein BD410DRAFT_779928 [Rickenella mellea]|uniref:Nuclear segregation protein Bfr1 n=1 Tax=Rickenella mellea TaxID=50990 RepID=A0A4R5XEI3_9AGAM|nr:hypothetical protein BD410DRAFT_779928 [Rickenella mellea]
MARSDSKPAAAANTAAAKGKSTKPAKPSISPLPSNADAPASASKVDELDTPASATRTGRPDKAVYDAEQESIKKEIEGVQAKLNELQEKISSATGNGVSKDRRAELHSEMDKIRQDQGTSKNSLSKIKDQLQALNENIQKKVKDLNAVKAKVPYKTVADIDARIQQLDRQIESGSMKLADEKRALQEVSQVKRSRRIVEGFQADQATIDNDRATAENLRKQLDDPEMKAVNERAAAIRAELDELKKESDELYGNRQKLFDERGTLKAQLDSLYERKRDSARAYKEDNDRYWAKVSEDRAKRAERARAERQAEEDRKKLEIAERLRDEASAPAFQTQIEDCQTLIDLLSGKSTSAELKLNGAQKTAERSGVTGVPKLELRQIDAPTDGLVARKKKGEDEEAYFVGGSKKGKGKKGGAKANGSATEKPTADTSQLNMPFGTLTALLAMAIPPPSSQSDVPRTIEDLKTKKSWYEANQTKQTAENIAKAEAEIKRLLNPGGKASPQTNGKSAEREHPLEPTPTPASGEPLSTSVPHEQVDSKLSAVQEGAAEEEKVVA